MVTRGVVAELRCQREGVGAGLWWLQRENVEAGSGWWQRENVVAGMWWWWWRQTKDVVAVLCWHGKGVVAGLWDWQHSVAVAELWQQKGGCVVRELLVGVVVLGVIKGTPEGKVTEVPGQTCCPDWLL